VKVHPFARPGLEKRARAFESYSGSDVDWYAQWHAIGLLRDGVRALS